MRARRVKDSKGTVRNHEHDITIVNKFYFQKRSNILIQMETKAVR